MVEKHTIIHVLEVLAAVLCAHHFWPRGITYGEQEEWEKKMHQKAHGHGKSKSSSREKSSKGRGNGDSHGRVRRDRTERYYDDRDRHYDDRYYDYEDRAPYSKNSVRSGVRGVY
jgi:hypothetical protein